MKPSFGWTLLSRDALRRAETQLRDDVAKVLDEIGFLALHQAYADRFFPGTSVLHTRLRYVLFIPWMYERISKTRGRRPIPEALEGEELKMTGRLKDANQNGVIGIQNYPKPTVQPPTMMYWSALSTWRILRPDENGTVPSRRVVHLALSRTAPRHQVHDDDRQPLFNERSVFVALPDPPVAWDNLESPLTFRLEPAERDFLRNLLLSVSRPSQPGKMSLMARLVGSDIQLNEEMDLWSPFVVAAADADDRAALMRAKQAGALAAIGRAVYSALVEQMRTQDGMAASNQHRSQLEDIVSACKADALGLKIEDIILDAQSIPTRVLDVLRETQSWLIQDRTDPNRLYEAYSAAEIQRKGARARLAPTMSGKERRAEWDPDKHPTPERLHYRWKNVRRLLMDLQGDT